MTTAELLALTPFQFLTRNEGPITDWDAFAQEQCYSDDFKDKYGFRPRYRSITEDELRNFYNSNYKVREWADGVNPFGGESTVYLGFSDARQAEIDEEEKYWAERMAEWEEEERWADALETGDFSKVRPEFEDKLTTEQAPLGALALVFG